jgi:hypothetical protein
MPEQVMIIKKHLPLDLARKKKMYWSRAQLFWKHSVRIKIHECDLLDLGRDAVSRCNAVCFGRVATSRWGYWNQSACLRINSITAKQVFKKSDLEIFLLNLSIHVKFGSNRTIIGVYTDVSDVTRSIFIADKNIGSKVAYQNVTGISWLMYFLR